MRQSGAGKRQPVLHTCLAGSRTSLRLLPLLSRARRVEACARGIRPRLLALRLLTYRGDEMEDTRRSYYKGADDGLERIRWKALSLRNVQSQDVDDPG